VSQFGSPAPADATVSPPGTPGRVPGEAVPPSFRRLSLGTSVLALVLIAIGGSVRATDSGLACPDWPRCFGLWIPPADLNIWIEHTHRLVAGVVVILLWVLSIWALRRFRSRADIVRPLLLALVLVHVQALLGALVVWHLLKAELVTAHLGMAMIVVGCLLIATVAAGSVPSRPGWSKLAKASAAVTGLTFAQILVGGQVTGIGASLAFTDFPTMGGTMWPRIETAPQAFHVLHRGLGFGLFLAVTWLALVAVQHRKAATAAGTWTDSQRWLVKLPMWAATLIVLQIVLGVANLWTRTSYLTVIPHLAVASWIWSVLLLQTVLAYRNAGDAA